MSAIDASNAPATPATTPISTTADEGLPTHRCRRCLSWFPYEPGEPIAGPTEWWLCANCQLVLIGPRK